MKEKIRVLFPEIEWIESKELQDKVLQVWEAAIEQGGWTVEDLEKIPFTLLIENTSINLLLHTRSVTQTAYKAAQTIQQNYSDLVTINFDELVAGGLLHDVGKLLEYTQKDGKIVKSQAGKGIRHPFSGMALAYHFGLSEAVQHMIAAHAGEGAKVQRTPEAFLIHHADFMNFEMFR